jgi:hypothetical protein
VITKTRDINTDSKKLKADTDSATDVGTKSERVVGGVNVSLQEGRLVLEGRLVNEALKGRLVSRLRQNY